MNQLHPHQTEILRDRYGLKLAARLSGGALELPHDISERLRVARQQAVSKRKVVTARRAQIASGVMVSGRTATMSFGDDGTSLWSRLAAILPLITLVLGLVTINLIQDNSRADEVAEVDAALLTDDLPPAAYVDSGFLQFLKSSGGPSGAN